MVLFSSLHKYPLMNLTASVETLTTPLSLLREKMTNSCVNILYSYRKFCATASSYGQLILPEALKLLPLYTLGIVWHLCSSVEYIATKMV